MSNRKDDTYSRIRGKLADYECDVPQSCWETVERRLRGQRRLKRHRRIARWAVSFAAAAVAGILLLTDWNRTGYPVAGHIAESRNNRVVPETETVAENPSPDMAGSSIADAADKKAGYYAENAPHRENIPETRNTGVEIQESLIADNPSLTATAKDTEAAKNGSMPDNGAESHGISDEEAARADNTGSIDTDTVSLDNLLEMYKKSEPDRLIARDERRRYSDPISDNGISISLVAANAFNANKHRDRDLSQNSMPLHEELSLYSNEEKLKFKHKMPISAGITVEKRWKNNWGIESGVMYTMLRSTYSTESNTQQGEQELHYIGIPVNVTYRFAEVKMLGFYAAAGPKIDFNVSGKRTESVENSYAKSNASESIRDKKPQFSLQLRLGVACTLVKHLELYVEPSLAYYIDNKGEIPDLWKDKPLNFVLQFGLRTGF